MSLPVSNSKASRDWYVKNFGFKVEFEVPERKMTAIQDDAGFTIFLYESKADRAGAKCSLTFQVKDVEATYLELLSRGVPFKNAPARYFWGYGAGLHDPDGYQIMLWDEVSMREKAGLEMREWSEQ
jgi:uncharacterized glyoxalase superfamily protein PhnB